MRVRAHDVLGHAPGGARIGLELAQPLPLPRARQVQPELQQQRALVHQHGLEAVDLVETLVELDARHLAVDALGDGRRVPGAGERARPPPRRQRAPVAPHVRPLALLVGGRREGERAQVARVHPLVELRQRLALAGPVDARDEQQHRKARLLAQLALGIAAAARAGPPLPWRRSSCRWRDRPRRTRTSGHRNPGRPHAPADV